MSTPIIATVSCNSVNGEIEIKVLGLNKDGTDYVIDVDVNKQFIAKIIEKNASNTNNMSNIILDTILEKVKNVLPNLYKKNEFRDLKPSVLPQSPTKFKVKIPIKSVITNLPNFEKVKQEFDKKYVKSISM